MSSDRALAALLEVTEAVAMESDLRRILDLLARKASEVIGAKSASILLTDSSRLLRLGGAYRLSDDYVSFLSSHFISHGMGAAGQAMRRHEPFTIEDITVEPTVTVAEVWRSFAARENYRSMVAVPLVVGPSWVGVLNIYRTLPGVWSSSDIALLASFGQHAAVAIHTAQLLDRQRHQVTALSRLVAVLREQTHEYANRLHAISGLLALGEVGEAERFVSQLVDLHHESYNSVVARINPPVVAALVVAEIGVAQQRGVELKLDQRSSLKELPSALGEAEAVTIIGNLLQNAVEAAESMPSARRRVSLKIQGDAAGTTFKVRDWGAGVPEQGAHELFERGVTTKGDHAGVGLTLVREAAASARGDVTIRSHKQGSTFTVAIPRVG